MAVKLNLLPQDYRVSGSVSTVLKISKPLTLILLGLFFTLSIGVTVFFIYSQVTLNNLNVANETLQKQIEAQKAAQQQLVLLKDRLGKIKSVLAKNASTKNLKAVDPIIKSLTPDTALENMELDSQKSELAVNFYTNTNLSNYFKTISTQNIFSGILLNSLQYDPIKGYVADISFTAK